MKTKLLKLKTKLSFIAVFLAIPFSMYAQYCDIADADEVVVEEITKVDFAGTSISNADSSSALIDKTDTIIEVTAGETYILTVEGNTYGDFENSIVAFIDWNQNEILNDNGEVFELGIIENSTGADNLSVSMEIIIPEDATLGETRIRITKIYTDDESPALVNPCALEMDAFGVFIVPGFGQALDFTLDIKEANEEEDACEWTVKVWTYTTYAEDIYWELTNEDGILLSGDNYDLMFIDEQSIHSSGPVEFYISTIGDSGDNEVNFSISNESGELISGHLDPNEEATFSDLLCADEGTPIDEDEYCQPFLDCTGGDVITNVTFQEIDNDSDCNAENGGYSDFTDMQATVQAGGTYPISVSVGDGWMSESVSVWIDFDNSGTFDEEEFFYIGTGSDEALTAEITIPLEVSDGDYRMRVRVAAVGESGATWNMSCDTNEQFFGETEDYTVTVDGTLGIADNSLTKFSYYPNPMQDVLHIQADESIKSITVYDLLGKKVLDMKNITGNNVGVASLPTGTFVFQVIFDNGSVRNFKAVKR